MGIGEGNGVEHASPRTEGFGFGLRSAIGMAETDPGETDDSATRVRFRDHGMDTLFGLWMPSAYAADVQASMTGREAAIQARLRAIGQRLADPAGQQTVSIGVQKGPPIGVQKGTPPSSGVTDMMDAPFALLAA